ncbi:MAG: blue light receptor [Sclerophora amabilis]|nr:MAG: blue light receptor [Sclerophora amabilis]
MPVEPVGLTLGVAALASLFTTCIECFDLIQLGRTFGRDSELLFTQFEVEKTRLLIWGDSVNILGLEQCAQSSRLYAHHVQVTVEKILHCIFMLFADVNELSKRYGLKRERDQCQSAVISERSTATRKTLFKASFARFTTHIARSQASAGISTKTRWAIHDRAKFKTMVDDLGKLIDGVTKITKSADSRYIEHNLIQEEIDSLPDISSLRLVQEACAESHPDWSEAAVIRLGDSDMGSEDRKRILKWMESNLLEGGVEDDPLEKQRAASEEVMLSSVTEVSGRRYHNMSTNLTPMRNLYREAFSYEGFDEQSILARVVRRANPEFDIGDISMACSVVFCDASQHDLPIVHCSAAFQVLTGYSRHEILGRNCRFLQTPGGKDADRNRYVDSKSTGYLKGRILAGQEAQVTLINYRKNGQAFLNLLTVVPIAPPRADDGAGQGIQYFVGLSVDLMQLSEARLATLPDQLRAW